MINNGVISKKKNHFFYLIFVLILLLFYIQKEDLLLKKTEVPSLENGGSLLQSFSSVESIKLPSIVLGNDVRSTNLLVFGPLGERTIQTLRFDQNTIWTPEDKKIAEKILILGMNPGLGIRELHNQGITGNGITVAIIDHNLDINHPEFQGKIIKYFDIGTGQPSTAGSFHGPAVTSLLVGNNIGTAPNAKVYYVAVPSWTLDAKYYADALDWIIKQNKKLPENEKIRVVSVSATPSGLWSEFSNAELWDAAYKRATEAGILVLDCSYEEGITVPCTYDLHNPDKISECHPNWRGPIGAPHLRVNIPISRTIAVEDSVVGTQYSYQYLYDGGLSWTTPYIAGVLAMGWQINPKLSNSQILQLIYDTAYRTYNGLLVINPPAFIAKVKKTLEE